MNQQSQLCRGLKREGIGDTREHAPWPQGPCGSDAARTVARRPGGPTLDLDGEELMVAAERLSRGREASHRAPPRRRRGGWLHTPSRRPIAYSRLLYGLVLIL